MVKFTLQKVNIIVAITNFVLLCGLSQRKMVSKTTSIHRVEEKKENFKRRLYGNKTYITVKEEARENPKPRVNYLREVLDDKEMKMLIEFYEYLITIEDGVQGDIRKQIIINGLYHLRRNGLKVKLYEISLDNIKKVLLQIKSMSGSWSTINGYKKCLKKFLNWRAYGDETLQKIQIEGYPKLAKYITTKRLKTERNITIRSDEVLTRKECLDLITNARYSRDKALISMLVETGARIGEIGNLRIKDIEYRDNPPMYILKLKGKTGERENSIQIYFKQLNEWLSEHPLKDREDFRDCPLWVNIDRNNKMMSYSTIRKQLKTITKNAGIKKRVYPHLFRHTYFTHKREEGESVADIQAWLGHAKGSTMSKIYDHADSRTVIAKKSSKLSGKSKRYTADYKECQNGECGIINPKFSDTCWKCKTPLGADSKIHYTDMKTQSNNLAKMVFDLQAKLDKITESITVKEIVGGITT